MSHAPVATALGLCGSLGLAVAYAPRAAADDTMTFLLQGSAGVIDGFDDTHAGRAANFIPDGGDGTAIYDIASDWVGGHNPNFVGPWPKSDGIVGWDYWDAGIHDADRRGPEVRNENGDSVYRDNVNGGFAFIPDGTTAAPGQEKLYYLANATSVGPLSFGNDGPPTSDSADRQHVALAEYNLAGPRAQGFSGADLIGATYSIFIDDVINMDLITTNGALPSTAFVNVFEGDGDLVNFESVQRKFEYSDHSSAADSVALEYQDIFIEDPLPITDFAISRANQLEQQSRLQFDFDITEEVAALLDADADFAGVALGSTGDGGFTLGSIDSVVLELGGDEVLENYLPLLTLEFAAVSAPLPGDYDGDGQVAQGDLNLVLNNWGIDLGIDGFPEGWLNFRDFAGPVAQAQLNAVLNNWGALQAPGFAGASIPEPTMWVSLYAAAGVLLRRRKRGC
ncbi:MAG: hypothetical protein AAGD32_16735 [Planctomycetota bacterium]